MWSKIANLFNARQARTCLAVLVGASLALSTHAAEMWKVNVEKSKFGPGSNTLVLDRYTGKAAAQDVGVKGNAIGRKFLVISNGKVYVATDFAADAAASKGIKTVDFTRWKEMEVVQIGDNVRSAEFCGVRCQAGLPSNHMTLTFHAKGADTREMMNNSIVLNAR